MKIEQLDIEGFRSFRKASWRPGDLNLIIGPNGSGKSNLLRFLELLSVSAQGRLGKYVQSLGGMDPIVWDGKADSIKCVLKTSPVGEERAPERYELEMARLGGGSSYRIGSERLTDFFDVRSGLKDKPLVYLERHAKSAVIFDSAQRQFVTPEEFVSDVETLLSLASGPFTHNPRIPPFRGLWLRPPSITTFAPTETHTCETPSSPAWKSRSTRMARISSPCCTRYMQATANSRGTSTSRCRALLETTSKSWSSLPLPTNGCRCGYAGKPWNGGSRWRRCPTERYASSFCWPFSQTPHRRP